jgi:hypothetical protein
MAVRYVAIGREQWCRSAVMGQHNEVTPSTDRIDDRAEAVGGRGGMIARSPPTGGGGGGRLRLG